MRQPQQDRVSDITLVPQCMMQQQGHCHQPDSAGCFLVMQADGDRRKAELVKAKADKEDREARALALVSVGAGRSKRSSTRSRPQSAK
jgi:hypothetical protein